MRLSISSFKEGQSGSTGSGRRIELAKGSVRVMEICVEFANSRILHSVVQLAYLNRVQEGYDYPFDD